MMIEFTRRNEDVLHCRFCFNDFRITDLWETKPVKGIVCDDCKEHLESYLSYFSKIEKEE